MSDENNSPSTANVSLTAYQQGFVSNVADTHPPSRFLLLAPTGAGKTVALAAAAKALKAKRGILRCLAIAPAPLAPMWQEQLLRFGGIRAVTMNPQTYRRLQAESGAGENVWSQVHSAVASIDFLKSPGRMDEVLEAGWDLVLLDEVHRSTASTQRGDVAREVWSAPTVAIAIATTATPQKLAWLAEDARTTTVRWKLADVIGRTRPQRRNHTIHYTFSKTESEIAVKIQGLLGQTPKDQRSQFTAGLLARRLESSSYAVEQTLRRLLTVEAFDDTELNDWSSDDLPDDADPSAAANSLRIDRQAGEQILGLLESEPADSKWECCFQLLSNRGIGTTCSGVLFTDYVDTAEYVEYLAKSRGLNVFLITGAVKPEAREHALDEIRCKPALLIATGVVEGTDLSFTNQVIHYDLPWNPQAFLRRIGRMERVTSPFEVFDHYYILNQNTAGTVLERLLEKVESIEQDWN